MTTPPYVWMNGNLIAWDNATLHVNTDAVLRGANVFEGLRAYTTGHDEDLCVFRLDDHLRRLYRTSMRVVRMAIPYSERDLDEAVVQTLRANELRTDTHIRIVAYFGDGPDTAFQPEEISTGCFVLTLPRGPHPKAEGGVRATVSPWRRINDLAMPPRVKAGANYLNSRLANVDAHVKGFDIPILLGESGKVSEGPGQAIFIVRDEIVCTPRTTNGILESITRDTVFHIASKLGVAWVEREIDFTELLVADEIFFAGTAVEILPVVEVDGYVVGDGRPGMTTRQLQAAYMRVARRQDPAPRGWLRPVYEPGDSVR